MWWALLAGSVPLTGVVLFAVLLLPVPCPTKANFDRLKLGMTEKEVEGILGGPGGNGVMGSTFALEEPESMYPAIKVWHADGEAANICVVFDASGKAERKLFVPMGGTKASPSWREVFDRWRRRLLGR
jgi:hypothetical protein